MVFLLGADVEHDVGDGQDAHELFAIREVVLSRSGVSTRILCSRFGRSCDASLQNCSAGSSLDA